MPDFSVVAFITAGRPTVVVVVDVHDDVLQQRAGVHVPDQVQEQRGRTRPRCRGIWDSMETKSV